MTVTLSPKTEVLLREQAAREGKDVDALADALIGAALTWESWDKEETMAAIQRSLDDFDAGRYRSFDEFATEKRTKYSLRGATPIAENGR
jgi:hypothetical protein